MTAPKNALRNIAAVVSRHTGVPADAILAPGRLGPVVIARFIAVEHLLEQFPLLPAPTLGELFGRSVGWAHFASRQRIVDARFRKIKKAIADELATSQ